MKAAWPQSNLTSANIVAAAMSPGGVYYTLLREQRMQGEIQLYADDLLIYQGNLPYLDSEVVDIVITKRTFVILLKNPWYILILKKIKQEIHYFPAILPVEFLQGTVEKVRLGIYSSAPALFFTTTAGEVKLYPINYANLSDFKAYTLKNIEGVPLDAKDFTDFYILSHTPFPSRLLLARVSAQRLILYTFLSRDTVKILAESYLPDFQRFLPTENEGQIIHKPLTLIQNIWETIAVYAKHSTVYSQVVPSKLLRPDSAFDMSWLSLTVMKQGGEITVFSNLVSSSFIPVTSGDALNIIIAPKRYCTNVVITPQLPITWEIFKNTDRFGKYCIAAIPKDAEFHVKGTIRELPFTGFLTLQISAEVW